METGRGAAKGCKEEQGSREHVLVEETEQTWLVNLANEG